MRSLVIAVLLTSPIASSEPIVPDAAIDVGVASVAMPRDVFGLGEVDQSATVPYAGVRGGVRTGRFALGAFASYTAFGTAGGTGSFDGLCYEANWREHDHVVDLGARVEVRARGAFLAISGGTELLFADGVYTEGYSSSPMPPVVTTSSRSYVLAGVLARAELGYTFPRLAGCRCAPQIVAAVQYAQYVPTPPDFGPPQPDHSEMARVGVGLVFW